MLSLDRSINAPLAIEGALLSAEREKFPDWENGSPDDPLHSARCARQEEEWKLADTIVCGSQFVIDAGLLTR